MDKGEKLEKKIEASIGKIEENLYKIRELEDIASKLKNSEDKEV